jgi:proteasome accessory factor B
LNILAAANGNGTVRHFVDQTGVSEKTIRRDLDLLKQAGFPLVEVVGERGRKHWQLDGGASIAQLRFTLEEAAALYLGRQFLEPLAGTYFFDGARSAFNKIRATLGPSSLRYLEQLAAAFYHKSHGYSMPPPPARRLPPRPLPARQLRGIHLLDPLLRPLG